MILLLVAVSFLFQGCVAETCYKDVWRQSIFGRYLDTDSFSCPDECCGETFERYCCPKNKDHWSVVAIAAVTIGVVGLLCAIALLICIVKMCTKTGTHGRVVQPGYNMQVWATNTGTAPGTSGYYSTSVEPSVPPPYTGPGIPRPHPEKSDLPPP